MSALITAYRFNLLRGNGIQSPIYQGNFRFDEPAVCRAMLKQGAAHTPPGRDCECGIYAITDVPAYEAFKAWVPGLHRDPTKLAFCKVLLWDAVPSTSPGDVAGTLRGSRARSTHVWVQGSRALEILTRGLLPSAGSPTFEAVNDLGSVIMRELSALSELRRAAR
jgi:hypothetical protein